MRLRHTQMRKCTQHNLLKNSFARVLASMPSSESKITWQNKYMQLRCLSLLVTLKARMPKISRNSFFFYERSRHTFDRQKWMLLTGKSKVYWNIYMSFC